MALVLSADEQPAAKGDLQHCSFCRVLELAGKWIMWHPEVTLTSESNKSKYLSSAGLGCSAKSGGYPTG